MARQKQVQAVNRANTRYGNNHAALPSGKVKASTRWSTSVGRARAMQESGWLRAFRRYLGTTVLANLVWEFAQMPLYTVWQAPWAEIAFAGLHCLGGDLLIASASILAALVVLNAERWPERRFRSVAAATMALGLGYTVFSEWLNVSVRQTWAYSDLMTTVTPLEIGVSPLLQWIVVPALAFFIARPPCRAKGTSFE